MDAVLQGQPAPKGRPSIGCNIKWWVWVTKVFVACSAWLPMPASVRQRVLCLHCFFPLEDISTSFYGHAGHLAKNLLILAPSRFSFIRCCTLLQRSSTPGSHRNSRPRDTRRCNCTIAQYFARSSRDGSHKLTSKGKPPAWSLGLLLFCWSTTRNSDAKLSSHAN